MHVLVTRPEEDAETFAAALRDLGHDVSLCPLLVVEAVPAALNLAGVQALIATSRNAIRGLVEGLSIDAARLLPIVTVGPGTAALARDVGFETVIAGPATAHDLASVIPAHFRPEAGALLHLTGDKLAFDLKGALEAQGFSVRQTTVYRTRAATALPVAVTRAIAGGTLDAVTLMSPRTAATFVDLAVSAGLSEPARALSYYCLSEAVAAALTPLAPPKVVVSALPNSQEMLALLAPKAPDSI